MNNFSGMYECMAKIPNNKYFFMIKNFSRENIPGEKELSSKLVYEHNGFCREIKLNLPSPDSLFFK